MLTEEELSLFDKLSFCSFSVAIGSLNLNFWQRFNAKNNIEITVISGFEIYESSLLVFQTNVEEFENLSILKKLFNKDVVSVAHSGKDLDLFFKPDYCLRIIADNSGYESYIVHLPDVAGGVIVRGDYIPPQSNPNDANK